VSYFLKINKLLDFRDYWYFHKLIKFISYKKTVQKFFLRNSTYFKEGGLIFGEKFKNILEQVSFTDLRRVNNQKLDMYDRDTERGGG